MKMETLTQKNSERDVYTISAISSEGGGSQLRIMQYEPAEGDDALWRMIWTERTRLPLVIGAIALRK